MQLRPGTTTSEKDSDPPERWRTIACIVAATTTVSVGFIGLITITNHLSLIAYNFMLTWMAIAWDVAVSLISVWAVMRYFRQQLTKQRKRTEHAERALIKRIDRSERALLDRIETLEGNLMGALDEAAIGRWMTMVKQDDSPTRPRLVRGNDG